MLPLAAMTQGATKKRRKRGSRRTVPPGNAAPRAASAARAAPSLTPLTASRRPVRWTARKWAGRLVGQPVRTALVVFVWLGFMIPYVGVVAVYSAYGSALIMGMGLALFAGIAVHVWPTRTPPWRTVAWAAFTSALTGAELLLVGAGRLALTGAMLVGLTVVLLRINSNGRRLVGMFRTWRTLR
jgi:hypothetical protein